MPKPIISIIIPTFDRPSLLDVAIKSCMDQQAGSKFEIIVVDNHPRQTAKSICIQYKKVSYYFEKKTGHSYAKNAGLKHANGEYVIFLDDDARLPNNWAANALKLISEKRADIFGGPIEPYFEITPPAWFKPEYEARRFGLTNRFMRSDEFLATSSTLIRTAKLKRIAGFNNDYGIKGENRRFGEDTDVLRRLRQDITVKTFYSPSLKVEHFTPSQKVSVWYRCKHHLNLGSSGPAVSDYPIGNLKLVLKSMQAAIKITLGFSKAFINRDTSRYPHYQNYVCEVVAPEFYWFGRLNYVLEKYV